MQSRSESKRSVQVPYSKATTTTQKPQMLRSPQNKVTSKKQTAQKPSVTKGLQGSVMESPSRKVETLEPRYEDSESDEDPLLMAMAVNNYNRILRQKAYDGFLTYLFNKQHKSAHISVTRGDLRKRQVFFYWYLMMEQLRAEKQQYQERATQLGLQLQVCIDVHSKRVLLKTALNRIAEYTSPERIQQQEEESIRNQLLWSKVNSWLTEPPKPKSARQNRGILKNAAKPK